MPRLSLFPESVRRWWPACLVFVAAALTAMPAQAQEQFDLEVEQKLLLDLFRDGKYKQAISESRRLEKLVKPTKKNTPPSRATRLYIELLIYRGTIERRMGSLDDADRTLTEAYKRFTDPAFQQFIDWSTPAQDPARNAYLKQVEISYLNLLDNGTEVVLEKIRRANQRRQVKSTQPAQAADAPAAAETDDDELVEQPKQIEQWFRQVDEWVRQSKAARSSLRGKVSDKGNNKFRAADEAATAEDAGGDSPQTLMLMSMSRPYRYFGMRYLEASKLPWTLSFDSDAVAPEEPSPGRKPAIEAPSEPIEESADERLQQAASQRFRAAAYLKRSTDIAETAMAPALGGLPAEREQAGTEDDPEPATAAPLAPALVTASQEAARIRAERLVPMAEVALLECDLAKARSLIDKALTGLREAEPPGYPELARPLIISAEVAFAESRQSLAAGNNVEAHDKATLAVESLRQAQQLLTSKNSEFDPTAPIHLVLAEQLALAQSFERGSSQTAAATTAANAAARRALAALKAPPKPKPVVPPAASPQAGQPAGPPNPPGAGNQPAPGNRGPQPVRPPQQVRVPPGPPKPPAESE